MMALIAAVLIIGGFLLAAIGFSMMDISDWSSVLYGTGLFMVILDTGCAVWVLATLIWVEVTA